MDPCLVLRRTCALGAAAAILLLVLIVAPGARPAGAGPLVVLDPVTVVNGTAVMSGTVSGSGVGTSLSVNGNPLALDGAGHFEGVVSLEGASAIDLAVSNPAADQNVHYQIPLTGSLLGAGGVIPADVLNTVEQAGVSLLNPVGGLKVLDGLPLTIGGKVADKNGLANLSLNGVDALSALRPDGSFTVTLPGTTKEVTLTVTDKQGISETKTFRVIHDTSLIWTSRGISVSATGALGLRIASVRYLPKGVIRSKRMRMVVTLEDRRNYLVRGATVSIRLVRGKLLVKRVQTKKSSKVGTATFVLRVRKAAFGRRLVIDTTAKTPSAKASKRTSVRLSRIKAAPRKHAHRKQAHH